MTTFSKLGRKQSVEAVPRGVWGSRVPVRSSADMGESFSEVIDQHPETPSVLSTCKRTKRMEIQSPGPRRTGQSIEYGGWRLDGVRVGEERR